MDAAAAVAGVDACRSSTCGNQGKRCAQHHFQDETVHCVVPCVAAVPFGVAWCNFENTLGQRTAIWMRRISGSVFFEDLSAVGP